MTAYDLETSYLADSELVDLVQEATLEIPTETGIPDKVTGLDVHRGDLSTTEFRSIAAGLSLSSSAAAFVVWPPIDSTTKEAVPLNIKQGSVLRITDDNSGWIVQAHEQSRFGHYVMLCDAEIVNAPT